MNSTNNKLENLLMSFLSKKIVLIVSAFLLAGISFGIFIISDTSLPKVAQVYQLTTDKISSGSDIMISLPREIKGSIAKRNIVFTPKIEGEWIEEVADDQIVFRPKEEGGTISAANSSGITDGGAAVVLMRADIAKAEGIEPLAIIKGFASAGVEPARMGLAPVPATHKVMEQTGLGLDDFDLIELNEAFAAQVLIVERELKWDVARRNVHGGAVGLGHPTGCTGARIVLTLMGEMLRKEHALGLAALCIGGGQGMATVLERV